MAWSSETDATQLTSITTAQTFNQKPTLNPGESAHVRVDVDFPVTPSDDLIVNVYASLDGTDYDDTPVYSFAVDHGTDPNQVSFLVTGFYQFEVEVVRESGGSDTITSADMSYRTDGISI